MKRNIWIINHYACDTYFDNGGRHYYFAKYLKESGYLPTIFCSNSMHGNNKTYFEFKGSFEIKTNKPISVDYVFVKARPYKKNGFVRILNMIDFYRRMIKIGKTIIKYREKPDVIYASSVHPLALVAGIKLAKKFKIKCISEVRDLWPESIVAYSKRLKPTGLLCKLMYAGEKWIYSKSDKVIMTWPGGYDYIIDRGWQNIISRQKVVNIPNGVDNSSFKELLQNKLDDPMLNNEDVVKFVYTGSIRKVNNLKLLIEADKILEKKKIKDYIILIYGSGDELFSLIEYVKDCNLKNIIFKGQIKKEFIPYVLSKCNFSILHNTSTILDKYGQSQNKLFEYLAIGHPILMTYSVNHGIVREHNCGLELNCQTADSIAEGIIQMCNYSNEEYKILSNNCKFVAKKYDYIELSKKLIEVIEEL